jgi:hypothetical protein
MVFRIFIRYKIIVGQLVAVGNLDDLVGGIGSD